MRNKTALALVLASLTAGASRLALADAGYSPPPPPAQTQTKPDPNAQEKPGDKKDLTPRQQAEKLYADAYELVQEGKSSLKDGKAKGAEKAFKKALEKSQDAVGLDSTYYEAWNLVAFCNRKSGHLELAFPAYFRCLGLNPNYEVAHEYLGEAYLMADSLDRAHEQLTWLRKKGSEYAPELKDAMDAYAVAHPASADSAKVGSH